MKLIVTGGCGFIGSAVVRQAIAQGHQIVNVDSLTYAANPENLAEVADSEAYSFVQADIRDHPAMDRVFEEHQPDAIMHLAAESHVDRSIDGPAAFIETNVIGTYILLEAARTYWSKLDAARKEAFRFHHVSTDEVFGSLGDRGYFTETTPYDPRSPYSSSKASSDHLVRAWHSTYGIPMVMTNCSNNYGPYQFPEKLIPVVTLSALYGKPIPVYGKGLNVRDWIHVEDHAAGLLTVLFNGRNGQTYNIGSNAEKQNIEMVHQICAVLDQRHPEGAPHDQLITYVSDRPGHDFRYAIDSSKIRNELGWAPTRTFEEGLTETVDWYLDNEAWWHPLLERSGVNKRLGLG